MGPSIKYVSTFFWETGLKIREKMMTVMYKKVLSLGMGWCQKYQKRYFMEGPYSVVQHRQSQA